MASAGGVAAHQPKTDLVSADSSGQSSRPKVSLEATFKVRKSIRRSFPSGDLRDGALGTLNSVDYVIFRDKIGDNEEELEKKLLEEAIIKVKNYVPGDFRLDSEEEGSFVPFDDKPIGKSVLNAAEVSECATINTIHFDNSRGFCLKIDFKKGEKASLLFIKTFGLVPGGSAQASCVVTEHAAIYLLLTVLLNNEENSFPEEIRREFGKICDFIKQEMMEASKASELGCDDARAPSRGSGNGGAPLGDMTLSESESEGDEEGSLSIKDVSPDRS